MTFITSPSRVALLFAALFALTAPVHAADDFSPAERALFITNQLATLRPPATLKYSFRKSGSLEEGFDDRVSIRLSAQPDGACCAAAADFLSGSRQLPLPEIESAQGNPVILYFLERDIREMERLTKGKANYFRKRIRMAVFQGAQIRAVSVPYQGKDVSAQQITVTPYLDDPLRERFAKLANKQYVFTLSDAVPGGVYAIRTRIDADSAATAPLLVEEMLLEGGTPAPRQP